MTQIGGLPLDSERDRHRQDGKAAPHPGAARNANPQLKEKTLRMRRRRTRAPTPTLRPLPDRSPWHPRNAKGSYSAQWPDRRRRITRLLSPFLQKAPWPNVKDQLTRLWFRSELSTGIGGTHTRLKNPLDGIGRHRCNRIGWRFSRSNFPVFLAADISVAVHRNPVSTGPPGCLGWPSRARGLGLNVTVREAENGNSLFVCNSNHVCSVPCPGPHVETLVRDCLSVAAIQNLNVDFLCAKRRRHRSNPKEYPLCQP